MNGKNWEDLSQEERDQLEEEYARTPGNIDYVVAHLSATYTEKQIAAQVLQEIKNNSDSDLWLNTATEEILYLLEKGRML